MERLPLVHISAGSTVPPAWLDELQMPAWSPEIANEFIGLALAAGRPLNQSQLQKLVYIAHGWCLAFHDQPLTGDRPEAWDFGPVYRRLADALRSYGLDLVDREILIGEAYPGWTGPNAEAPARGELEPGEHELIATVYRDYGGLETSQLSAWTRKGTAPWAQVFANGAGEFRDIPHDLVKAQFAELASGTGVQAPGG
jgi:uncharacterized phage-associated protein